MKTSLISQFLLFAFWTECTVINISTFEGQNASILCAHKLAWGNNKYFCKNPCKSDGDVLVAVKPGERAESGRITLMDLGNGDFTVHISQVQLLDTQKYFCGVERDGIDTFHEVRLNVIKAPTTNPELEITSSTTCLTVTQLESETGTVGLTGTPTASNFTYESNQYKRFTAVTLYTLGALALVFFFILATLTWKSRNKPKRQRAASSSSTNPNYIHEREVDGGYEICDVTMRRFKKPPVRPCVPVQHQLYDTFTFNSQESEHSLATCTYENTFSLRESEDLEHSTVDDKKDNVNESERKTNGSCQEVVEMQKYASYDISGFKSNGGKLWFGLDLSANN